MGDLVETHRHRDLWVVVDKTPGPLKPADVLVMAHKYKPFGAKFCGATLADGASWFFYDSDVWDG